MPSPTNSNSSSSRLSSDGSLASSPVLMNGSMATQSPVPVKRPRYGYSNTGSVKGAGLKLRNQNGVQVKNTIGKRLPPGTSPTLSSNLSPVSSDGRTYLQILSQPEEQHRARYQTEGSRGAIKDRKCNGFPTVKLFGYDKPTTLQIFIGTDQGKASPHMFYQACKVTGKSSTPCMEKKVEGTVMIEIEFDPTKDMTISCDCVGILKERNVDVEQRFPFHHASAAQSRKKSTKCRMVFRTTIVNANGIEETLQVSSLPILCTQPPGQPEICKQSMNECAASGGKELFIIGKNFLKDTKVLLQEENNHGDILWEAKITPHKDFLQQTHLICMIPSYRSENIATPVDCKISVWSGGKTSEPHRFTYLPNIAAVSPMRMSDGSPIIDIQGSPSSINADSPLVASGTLSGSLSNSSGMSSHSHMSPTGSISSPLLSNHNVVCASPPDAALDMGSSMQMQPMTYETGMIPAQSSSFTAVEELKTLLEQTQDEASQHPTVESVLSEVKSEEMVNPAVIDLKPSPSFAGLAQEIAMPMNFSESSNNFNNVMESPLLNLINNNSNQMNPIIAAAIGENSHHAILPIMANNNISDGGATTMNNVLPTLTPLTMTVTCEPLLKTENAQTGAQEGQPQNGHAHPQGVFINGDFQGPIANALTQMSDNELINYINPSCFDQGAF